MEKWQSLLQVVDQFSQHHLLKRLPFLHCIFLAPLSLTDSDVNRTFTDSDVNRTFFFKYFLLWKNAKHIQERKE